METIEKSIEVHVPVHTAYNQWTQFEDFPRFMEGVKEVHHIDDTHMHWTVDFYGREEEWDAVITEQIPDERIAWQSTGGSHHAGVVTFHHLNPESCKIMLQLGYDPEGFVENMGDKMGFVRGRVEADLGRFRDFIESRGAETGAWRGEVRRESAPMPEQRPTGV